MSFCKAENEISNVVNYKADIALPGIAIEGGKKYYYSFKMNAENGQSGECLVESASQSDANRVHFNGFSAGAGEEIEVSGVFTADSTVADPVIRLQIGNPSDGVSSNSILIDDVVFGVVEGDLLAPVDSILDQYRVRRAPWVSSISMVWRHSQ